ncbi:hypothetical protein RJ639_013994 [Escallonia herrerae]|uniref:Essential protein Yae1 N-terminal domain-containing protein n=1 Tax=Escallonia herrerae TaxID=1293975 RepID=A0AA88VF93_9ASTE|nr:hypothetical protein RJ639_013994 [Escallonia herrerae]
MHSKDSTNVFHAVVFFVSKMEGSFADELYAESMKLSNADFSTPLAAENLEPAIPFSGFSTYKLRTALWTWFQNIKFLIFQSFILIYCLVSDGDSGELWHEDGSSWNGSVAELNNTSELDREWQRRRNQFHTIGYRDGLMAGKEASAQEGFNIGFKESVFAGFNWGLVRGVTSALACLPDGLRERLVETQESRNSYSQLYENVHSLSTTDALKLFHDDLTNKLINTNDNAEVISSIAEPHDESSDGSSLENYYAKLQLLMLQSPGIRMHLKVDG